MSVHPSGDPDPISIFIQVQPRNRNSLQTVPLPSRTRSSRINRLKRRCEIAEKCLKKYCKRGARIARTVNIPILEEAGNEEKSLVERVEAAFTFFACIFVAFALCWFLEKETTKNPMEEEMVGVDIARGPLPAVEIRLENMFTPEFLEKLEITFSLNKSDSGPPPFRIETKEKISLAYLVGQLIAGKHGIFKTITNFLNYANTTSDGFVPSNNPNHPAMKAAIEIAKQGMFGCDDIMRNCEIGGQEEKCTQLFTRTLSPRGIGCTFNALPASALERIGTIRAQISETIKPEEVKYWKQLDKDGISFPNEKRDLGLLQTQDAPGEGNGISFTIDIPEGLQVHHFFLSVGNPRDHSVTKASEAKFSLASSHHLNLAVVAEYSTKQVQEIVVRERRKCSFYAEGNRENYDGYTFQRCFSSATARRRNCLLVSEMDPGKNGSKKLCAPSLLVDPFFQMDEKDYRSQGHSECPKSCNDIHYSFTPQSDRMTEYEPNRGRAEVYMFYSSDEIITRVKDLKGFTAEQIGIVLGMLGFCNDITLAKIIKLCRIIIVYLVTLIWGKVRQHLPWRRRNFPPTFFLPIIW